MFRLITIDFSQKSPHFSLLSPTPPCELSEREVTSPSNLKVVGTLDNYSLVFVIFINFFGQLKDWVGQVLFLVSCPKGHQLFELLREHSKEQLLKTVREEQEKIMLCTMDCTNPILNLDVKKELDLISEIIKITGMQDSNQGRQK
jgi:hypothetical protein